MQHLLILPGNSVENRTWGEVMFAHYGPQFGSARMASYEHWEDGGPIIDFDVELVKLRELQTAPLFNADDLVVMAKSAGSLLAFVAAAEGVVTPTKAIFFGIPFDMAAQGIFHADWSAVENFKVPTLIFHNEADPTTQHNFTEATVRQYLPQAEFVTTSGTDHWYGDTDTYNPYINKFLENSTKKSK